MSIFKSEMYYHFPFYHIILKYIYCGGLRRVLYFVFVQNATRGKIIDIPTVMHIFPSHHSFFSMSRKLMAKIFDNMISRHNLVYNN